MYIVQRRKIFFFPKNFRKYFTIVKAEKSYIKMNEMNKMKKGLRIK